MDHEDFAVSKEPTAATNSGGSSKVIKTFQMSLSNPKRSTQGSDTSSTYIDTYFIKIIEILPQVHMWPSSVLLSAYLLAHTSEFQNKVLFDLGAGCGLTSIAANLAGCKHVISSERSDEEVFFLNYNKHDDDDKKLCRSYYLLYGSVRTIIYLVFCR